MKDDTEGKPWGASQSLAIFGQPGTNQFEYVMTGRHMTIRADGNSEAHVALGGPIFMAMRQRLQRKGAPSGQCFLAPGPASQPGLHHVERQTATTALVAHCPAEAAVASEARPASSRHSVAELTRDQRDGLQKVLLALIEPYRKADQDEVLACLMRQGGLERCSLAFYRDGDIGDDSEWDNWRLEGPSFVWYFRGQPHVHIWVNVADDPGVQLNAKG